ncbi:MAG TPA: HipA family kinase [Candidatus Limnocylindria bacterium]
MHRRVEITRYVTPLREGSSLPALVEADDGGEYVIKFRGAGHGPKALIAELVVGEIGRILGLPVPEIVLATLPESIARGESHDEIRDLLGWSIGLNVGLAFVPGALAPDLTRVPPEGAEWAADVVWFDDLTINPDRTPRNANLIVHAAKTWLIDHGSALYVHHAWADPDAHARRPFERIAEHVLLPYAASIVDADARLASRVTVEGMDRIVDAIPTEWLTDTTFAGPEAERDAYRRYLAARMEARPTWVGAAESARIEVQRGAVA